MRLEEISFPLLIDGGLSNQLESQGCNLNHPLWTARLIEENPDEVVKAHLAYLEAGAQCIATMSYQASRLGYSNLGYSEEQADELIHRSVELAKDAIDIYIDIYIEENNQRKRPLIAASIGPYGAALADGSEYRGDYGLQDEELKEFHEGRIQLLNASDADLIAIETIPSLQEAKVLKQIIQETNKPSWISFSCQNETQINDGSDISELINLFKDVKSVFAIGVNCTAPKFISPLIRRIKQAGWVKHIIVYPNLGEVYDATTKTWNNSGQELFGPDYVSQWLNDGADIIGGCCRVGPQDISKVNHLF